MASTDTTTNKPPIWTVDEPSFYSAAFAYHTPWKVVGPYITHLSAEDETAFADWVDTYNVPVGDIGTPITNYDWRGYWIARVKGTEVGFTLGEHPPDIWLTPYSTRFSDRSIYAREGCPYKWQGDKLFNLNSGELIFWAAYAPLAPPGVSLTPGGVDPIALKKGAMGDDLDMATFSLYFAGLLKLKAQDQVLDAEIERTIEGASTLTVTLNDDDREILHSGLLSNKLDVELDGLWFRLRQVARDDANTLTLTFETLAVAILRTYNTVITATRATSTRAQFIYRMIREAEAQVFIPVVIPELGIIQRVEGEPKNPDGTPHDTGNPGIPTNLPPADDPIDTLLDPRRGLTVQGDAATKVQITNVNTILATASETNASRKVMVCAIMGAIEASKLRNLPEDKQAHTVGIYQINPLTQDWGRAEQIVSVAYQAGVFVRRAQQIDLASPDLLYWELTADVLKPEVNRQGYQQWYTEAENFVTAYTGETPQHKPDPFKDIIPVDPNAPPLNPAGAGADKVPDSPIPQPPTDGTGGPNDNAFLYYRGIPGAQGEAWGKEDSWTAIQRLADEVNWRAFFVGNTFWYVSEEWLFKRLNPTMILTETTAGVGGISFDYDVNKKSATVDVTCRIGRWNAQPGALVILRNLGVINGKWLVNDFTRSLFDLTAQIQLKKPRVVLPEPKSNTASPPDQVVTPPGVTPPPSTLVRCGQTAAQIDDFLKQKGSPMVGSGASFISAAAKYGVSAAFLVGLAGQESSYGAKGKTFHPFNPFGYGSYSFISWAEAIDTIANAIANGPYYFKRERYSALDVYLQSRGTNKNPPWSGWCTSQCNTVELLAAIDILNGDATDIRCSGTAASGAVPTGTCMNLAQQVQKASKDGKFTVYHSADQTDIDRAAQGLPCTDGVPIDCNVWRVMMYLIDNGYGPISSYAIHSAHGPDGLGGHSTGFAFDLNSTKGHDQGSDDPDGTYCMNAANFLRAAPAEVRPDGLIITGWQGAFHSEAADLCIPEGSYDGSGPTGFNWAVSSTSHANHIHICYTPGIPKP